MRCSFLLVLAAIWLAPSVFPQNGENSATTHSTRSPRSMLDATQFPGIDGCAMINSAIAALPPDGGIIDATGFASPQVVSTTCVSAMGTQIVEIDFSPSTRWVPSTPGMSILLANPKSFVRGLHIDASTVPGYMGNAVAFVQQNDADTDYTLLEDTQIDLPAGSGVGIYISPSATGDGYSGLNVRGLRIHGGSIGINMVSGPGLLQYLNSNNFSDFWIKNAVTCISMDGSAQITAETWLSAMAANHFSDGACQLGPDSINTIVLKNASDNSFSNVGTWDGGISSGDSTSNFNYWVGFGAGGVMNWLGQGNNYQDAHGDAGSPTGMHQVSYAGGVNFIGPKVQLQNGPNAVQWLPSSYDGYPAFLVSAGGAAGTYIGPLKINTGEYDQGGSILQTGSGINGSYGSGTDSFVPTENGWQVVGGGFSNVFLEGKSIDFQNGSTTWKLQEDPNGIRVVRLGCCSETLLDGNKVGTPEYDLNDGTTSKILLSAAAPVILSGFGVNPSIAQSNGSTTFTIQIGATGTAVSGVLNMHAAVNGWNCWCNDLTTTSQDVFMCKQTASTNSSVTLENFSSLGRPARWQPSDTISVSCFAY